MQETHARPHGIRLLVCGGRFYDDPSALWRALDQLDAEERIRCVIDGASDDVTGPYIGADYWAHQWALARQRATERFHADWKTQGRAAGPIRNRRMIVEGRPHLVFPFPGRNGTANMIKQAHDASIPVRAYRTPDATLPQSGRV